MNRTRRKLGNKIFYVLLLIKFSPSNGKKAERIFSSSSQAPNQKEAVSRCVSLKYKSNGISWSLIPFEIIFECDVLISHASSSIRGKLPKNTRSGKDTDIKNVKVSPGNLEIRFPFPIQHGPGFRTGRKCEKCFTYCVARLSTLLPRNRKKSASQKIHK